MLNALKSQIEKRSATIPVAASRVLRPFLFSPPQAQSSLLKPIQDPRGGGHEIHFQKNVNHWPNQVYIN
jgi:hypothetical protein